MKQNITPFKVGEKVEFMNGNRGMKKGVVEAVRDHETDIGQQYVTIKYPIKLEDGSINFPETTKNSRKVRRP